MSHKTLSKEDAIVLGKMCSTPAGVEGLKVLERLFYNTISFDPDSEALTNFNEGHRDVVQLLRNAAKAVKGN